MKTDDIRYNETMKKLLKIILIALLITGGLYLASRFLFSSKPADPGTPVSETLREDGSYTSMQDVALYLYTYQKLPKNYVTKSEAKKMGWVASEGNLQDVCKGCSIGGDSFANREGKLPKESGRKYYECDIDYEGGTRNGKRIIYSNDGLIYYTEDHYKTFILLYGEP